MGPGALLPLEELARRGSAAARRTLRLVGRLDEYLSATQLGCVIAFSSFDQPPPANSLFGRTAVAGDQVLCSNPAALGGGAPVRSAPVIKLPEGNAAGKRVENRVELAVEFSRRRPLPE